jgi:hypothetical protein
MEQSAHLEFRRALYRKLLDFSKLVEPQLWKDLASIIGQSGQLDRLVLCAVKGKSLKRSLLHNRRKLASRSLR